MAPRFAGKVAIVTGSSNGIGRATAVLLAEEGASLTIHGRSQQALEETLDLVVVAGAKKENVVQVLGDLTDEAMHKKLIDETIAKFGKIDILVNNAGGVPDNCKQNGFEQDLEKYDYTHNLNLRSVLSLTKLAVPHLAKTKGEVVNVSSIAAYPFAAPSMPYYSVAKAGQDQLTRSMAIEYIKKGIRVNSVNPGLISTAIFQKQGINQEQQKQFEQYYATPKYIPLGRVGQAREIADLIAFLLDRSKSEFIIGQCLTIDGGTSLLNSMFQASEEFQRLTLAAKEQQEQKQ